MRIEKVIIENINSLSGRFEIDFTDGRYSEGLFAITGPSGAGKTTVLDAICLALYGKTPRIETISETQDEIMNKNCAGCLAEAVFTSRGKRYKASFTHQRGKGEKPFRPVKREILEYSADGTAGVIASSIKEAGEKIVEITGLTYSQFTRSIMLAQFRFAEFLKADTNERAAILEQISDMDIYREISAAVYERTKSEKTALEKIKERMQALRVLDESQIQSLEQEERLLADAVKVHAGLQGRFAACRDACLDIEKLGRELEGYESASGALAESLAVNIKKFEQAEADEKQLMRALAELQKTLKAVRELDYRIAAQNAEMTRLNRESAETADKILARKKELKALFLKYFPDAGADELKELYDSPDAGEKMRSGAKASLNKAAAARQAVLADIKQNLQGRDEAYWNRRQDALRVMLAIERARESAEQAKQKLEQERQRETELAEGLKKLEADEKTAEERLVYARLEQRFGEERMKLEAGKPCPLCGSTEHPSEGKEYNAGYLNEAQSKKDDITRLIKAAHQELAAVKKHISDYEALIEENSDIINKMSEDLKPFGEEYSTQSGCPAKDIEQKLSEAERIMRANTVLLGKLNEASQNVVSQTEKMSETDRDVAAVESAKLFIEDIERQADGFKASRGEAEKVCAELKAQRAKLFGGKDADDEEEKAAEAAESARKQKDTCRERKERAERDAEQNKKDIARASEAIKAKGISLEEEFARAKAEAEASCDMSFYEEDIMHLHNEFQGLCAGLGERPKDSAVVFDSAARVLGELVSKETARRGAVGQMLSDNSRSVKEMGELKKRERKQVLTCAKWDRLNALIGSADGIKFSRMAQGYTFEVLLRYANSCLMRMTDRYVLVRDTSGAKTLELAVADNYQAGDRRPVSNLSGGESFIVSMALALGMSEMSSGKARIDSLFIDEGFASLDDDYLEAALQTLSSLGNREGKLVGVISHVGALKERIDAQIEVKKLSGGRSTLSGPGVSVGSQ